MAFMDYETVVLVCGTVFLALEGVVLARPAAAWCCRQGGQLSAAALRKRLAELWCCTRPELGTDLFSLCVARRLRLHMAKTAADIWYLCATGVWIVVLISMVNIYAGLPRWFTTANDVTVLLTGIMIFALTAFPRLTQTRPPCLWYSLAACLMTAFVAATPSMETLLHTSRQIVLFRLFTGVAFPHVRWGLFWNLLHCLVVCYKSTLLAVPDGSVIRPKHIIAIELNQLFAMVLFMHRVHQSLLAQSRHEVQDITLRGASSGMHSLLHLVCDVVVELDAELRIAEHVPRFAAVLSLASFKSTEGMRLSQFMPLEEDRATFERHLADHKNGASSEAGALHVRLQDSMTGHLHVEMFYVQFTGLDDSRHFFVGIREFAEQPVPALPSFAAGRDSGGRHQTATEVGRGTPPVVGSQSFLEEASEHSGQHSEHSGQHSDSPGRRSPSVASPASRGGGEAVWPKFRSTSDKGKDLTLVATMMRWYVPADAGTCCAFHAAVAHLSRCLRRLEGFGCAKGFSHAGTAQCRHCGVLAKHGPSNRSTPCTTCGRQRWVFDEPHLAL